MKKIWCLLVAWVVLSQILAFGQSKKYSKKEKKAYKEAESFYVYGDFQTAIRMFRPLVGSDTAFHELSYKLGDSYYQLKRYDSAAYFLKKGKSYNPDALFYLAEINLYYADLEQAKRYLTDFLSNQRPKETVIDQLQLKRLKGNLETAPELINQAEVVNIINLGSNINTENAEYVPLISSDETFLAFTSRRIREGNGWAPTGKPFEDIYVSRRTSIQEEWSKAMPIPGKVNTGQHDACVGLSPDGNRMFVYRSHENLVGGDLFESFYRDSSWTIPVKLSDNINNLYSIEPSASLSLDERVLYFSSNREGGYGGFDIYRVVLLPNGEWSLPKNLGSSINTSYDDDAPFIHPDGKTLYFSSKGHQNMGGYDVFKSEKTDSGWTKPQNMGYPTNTTKDDIYFTISANEQHGYYASDKEGGFGKHDIYLIDYLEKSLRQSVIRGVVKDQKSGEVVQADISLLELESADLSGVYLSNPDDGRFIFLVNPNVEYELIIEAEGYEEHSVILEYEVEDLKKTQNKTFLLKSIEQ